MPILLVDDPAPSPTLQLAEALRNLADTLDQHGLGWGDVHSIHLSDLAVVVPIGVLRRIAVRRGESPAVVDAGSHLASALDVGAWSFRSFWFREA